MARRGAIFFSRLDDALSRRVSQRRGTKKDKGERLPPFFVRHPVSTVR